MFAAAILCFYHYPFRTYLTMLNFCCIVVAILKMTIGRNFSMSGHHYLPTYQIWMTSDNVKFLRNFENFDNAELLI